MLKIKNIKKAVALVSVSAGLWGIGTIAESQLSQPTIVEAATKKITLKRNAYIYNYRGKRHGRRKLYKGHSYRYYNIKKIHGKRYYHVGKNQYVKAGNVLTKKRVSKFKRESVPALNNSNAKINTAGLGNPKFQVKLVNNNVDVFDSSNTKPSHWIFSIDIKGQSVNVYAEDNGAYEIGNGQWIQSEDTDLVDSSIINANNTDSSSNSKKNNNSGAISHKVDSNDPDVIASDGHLTEYQQNKIAQIFVDMINKDRAAKGVAPLTLDSSLTSLARKRAIHDGTCLAKTGQEDDHKNDDGSRAHPWNTSEVEAGISVIADPTVKNAAKFAYDQFMLRDAVANWGHRKELLSSDNTKIGVGTYFADGVNHFGSVVADLK